MQSSNVSELTEPAAPTIAINLRVYFYDTDAAAVAHNIAYLRWIEQARSELAHQLGWSLDEMIRGLCPVVRRTEVDYLAPARLNDEICVHASIVNLERVSFKTAFEIRQLGDSNVLICRALQTLAVVDVNTGKLASLPQAWRTRWPELIGRKIDSTSARAQQESDVTSS